MDNVESTVNTVETLEENLEAVATPKRQSIDWKPFLPEIVQHSKSGMTKNQFLREYAARHGLKELTVSQKYDKLRKDIKTSSKYTPEQIASMLDSIKFSDGRRVKGIKRTRKNSEPSMVANLASFMGILSDTNTDVSSDDE